MSFTQIKIIPVAMVLMATVAGLTTQAMRPHEAQADTVSQDGLWSYVTDHSQDYTFNPSGENYPLYEEPNASQDDPMEGLYLIMKHEGFSEKAYLCAGKKWTIGYGETAGVKPGDRISEPEARRRVKWLYLSYREEVRKLAPNASRLEIEALTSFAYNVGITAFKESTLLDLVNAGKTIKASQEFARWINAGGKKQGGLITRREDERLMFLS